MAKTSYKECWWLIQALDAECGSYKNGTGYSLLELNNLRPIGDRIARDDWYDTENIDVLKRREHFRQSLMRWRSIIYNEFGLGILQESTPGVIAKKGLGGYYYYIANPELLDENGKTLREHIKFLAESERARDSWVSLTEMQKSFSGGSSMGCLTAGGTASFGYLSQEGTSYRTILGEENLELIQFAMQFGEILTIKYGKVRTGVDINAPYSLEPYQLKEIEGRWYVIGNLYPLGYKKLAEIAIYDLARLQFADEENPDVLFEPMKGFDIWDNVLIEAALQRRLGKVIPADLIAHTEEFANYLNEHPFCSAQERLKGNTFRIYRCVTRDFLVQLGAYGKELTVGLPLKEGDEKDERYFFHRLLNILKKTDSEEKH